VVKRVDTRDLKSLAFGHAGSIPAGRTIHSSRDPTLSRVSFWLASTDWRRAVPGLWHFGNRQISVGNSAVWVHNNTMMKNRAKRSDRNHIIYELVVAGENYIGVTAKTESTVLKSVRARAAKHFYRAKTETKNWLLCEALRGLESKDEIEIRIHEIVRGKAEAHRREVEIRRAVKPTLNTDVRGD